MACTYKRIKEVDVFLCGGDLDNLTEHDKNIILHHIQEINKMEESTQKMMKEINIQYYELIRKLKQLKEEEICKDERFLNIAITDLESSKMRAVASLFTPAYRLKNETT